MFVRINAIVLAFLFSLSLACSSSNGPEDEKISVAGTYVTAVNLTANTCGSTISVQALPTNVTHAPGAAAITISHGASHTGTLSASGNFTTQPTVIADPSNGGIQSTITIVGQFNVTGFVADVTVDVLQSQTPNVCQYKVHWVGTKQGAPNIIPG